MPTVLPCIIRACSDRLSLLNLETINIYAGVCNIVSFCEKYNPEALQDDNVIYIYLRRDEKKKERELSEPVVK